MNPLFLPLPWLEAAILLSVVGALWVSRWSDPQRAWRWGMAFTGAVLIVSVISCVAFYSQRDPEIAAKSTSVQMKLFGSEPLEVNELNAPLIPLVALLHFLTALATGRTKMRRFSLAWSLVYEAIRLAIFGCHDPWFLVALLAAETVPAYLELRNRCQPTRAYVVHMAAFIGLMTLGVAWSQSALSAGDETALGWSTLPILAAILIRSGTVPAHCWLTDWFARASFGNALLFATPLTGVYTAALLVLPIAPDWAMQWLGVVSMITAFYAAGMALIQQDARRFFAYLFISHASLVLVGLELHTEISLTGALALWISVSLSLAGLGLTLRALEARFGRLSIREFRGLYDQSPSLAICFMVTGLASVGFPGTLGFVAAELLVDGVVQSNLLLALGVILAGAMNGIAIVRVYFRLFTGNRHASTIALDITSRERFAVLTLAFIILGGGLMPQPGLVSRYRAAVHVLNLRQEIVGGTSLEGEHPHTMEQHPPHTHE